MFIQFFKIIEMLEKDDLLETSFSQHKFSINFKFEVIPLNKLNFMTGSQHVNPYAKWLVELKEAVQTGEPAKINLILENGIQIFAKNIKTTEALIKKLSTSPEDGLKEVHNFVDERLSRVLH